MYQHFIFTYIQWSQKQQRKKRDKQKHTTPEIHRKAAEATTAAKYVKLNN